MKVLGVVLDRRLAFDIHASAVTLSCNSSIGLRHLLTTELAKKKSCTDVSPQSGPTNDRLLQRSVPRSSDRQHPQDLESPEQCSPDCHTGAKAITH